MKRLLNIDHKRSSNYSAFNCFGWGWLKQFTWQTAVFGYITVNNMQQVNWLQLHSNRWPPEHTVSRQESMDELKVPAWSDTTSSTCALHGERRRRKSWGLRSASLNRLVGAVYFRQLGNHSSSAFMSRVRAFFDTCVATFRSVIIWLAVYSCKYW